MTLVDLTPSMRLDRDVGITMRDGAQLRANLYLPAGNGPYPVLMTFGPYGKDVHISQFMPAAWERISTRHPEIMAASSCRHLVFETPDPEVWTALGYAVVKVDSRGAGRSPGYLDVNSPAEFRDFYDAIEWAGTQSWSNQRVGLLGISYYAAGQWMVAAMRPPHLAAILPWQGTCDFYRDRTRQDGIFSSGFTRDWWPRSVLRNQHGNPDSPFLDIYTGERSTGPAALSPGELSANRADYIGDILAHPMLDAWYQARCAPVEQVVCPAFVVANWGGLGLHLRGTIGGFMDIAAPDKWLNVQGGSYFITFLQPENVALQRRFFDHYLKGIDNGWEQEPKVSIAVRSTDDRVASVRHGDQWPLAGTQWTKFYLDLAASTLTPAAQIDHSISYQALSQGITFTSAALTEDTTIIGPVVLRLHVSSDTSDMDLFATLRAFDPKGREITFLSAIDPKCPVSQGWLRVSHRKLDSRRATPFRPVHTHDEHQPMVPGEIYEVDLEIWATSLLLPQGHTLALTIQGCDFERPNEAGPYKGSGFFLHNDPADRPAAIFAGVHMLHSGPSKPSFLLLPLYPNQ